MVKGRMKRVGVSKTFTVPKKGGIANLILNGKYKMKVVFERASTPDGKMWEKVLPRGGVWTGERVNMEYQARHDNEVFRFRVLEVAADTGYLNYELN